MKTKLLTVAALLAAVVMALSPAALAQEEDGFFVEGCAVSGEVLHVYFNASAPEAGDVNNLAAAVDGEPVEIKSVCGYDLVSQGTTYVLLADTNTAVTERALPDMRAVAERIAAGMEKMDNACVLALGTKPDQKLLTQDGAELSGQIAGLRGGGKHADLYSSMADAIEFMQTCGAVRPRACLVVMADGLDSSLSGITQSELEKKIANSGITICTVALTYNTTTPERVEAGKTLSSFARMSNGGIPMLLRTDGLTPADAADTVLGMRDTAYAAVISGEAIRGVSDKAAVELTLTLTTPSGAYSGSVNADIDSFPPIQSSPEAEPAQGSPVPEESASAPAPTPEPSGVQTLVKDIPWLEDLSAGALYALLAGAVALIAGGALAAVLAARAKKRRAAQREADRQSREGEPDKAAQVEFTPSGSPVARGPQGPHLMLVRMGQQENIRCDLTMEDSLTIGSSAASSQLIFSEDKRLAPAACRFEWQGGKLWIRDLAGGITLNGVPIAAQIHPVQSGDVIGLGSFQYRVFWDKN